MASYNSADIGGAVFLTVVVMVVISIMASGLMISNTNERWVDWVECLDSGASESFCHDTFKAPEGAR